MYVNGLFIGVNRLYRGVNSSLRLHRCVDRVYILKQVGVNRLYIGVNRSFSVPHLVCDPPLPIGPRVLNAK